MKKFDVIVVGAGSGGIGAAWSASNLGANVLLMERNSFPGGTFTSSGVSCWEASASGTGLSKTIYERAEKYPDALDIYPKNWKKRDYDLTLKVGGLDFDDRVNGYIKGRYGVIIEPEIYKKVVLDLLRETGKCELCCDCEITGVEIDNASIKSIKAKVNGEIEHFEADYYIDSTASNVLCEMSGCEMMVGAESRDLYKEPLAPPEAIPERANGASLIFRVTQDKSRMLDQPEWTLEKGINRPAMAPWMRRFPNGDWYVNPLPTFKGEELRNLAREEAYREGICRTWDIWEEIKEKNAKFADYGISWIAPELGVREGKRIISDYVLTQNDILDGLENQKFEDIIAVADHMFDMHGVHLKGLRLLKEPYGVPFRSLLPKGWNNLMVASRGAGFSQIAASSCRLSRTMMQLGQAAGSAAALAKKHDLPIRELKYQLLRSSLEDQGLVLDKASIEEKYQFAMKHS